MNQMNSGSQGAIMADTKVKFNISEIVEEAIQKHGLHADALIPILSEVNQSCGYIPVEAIHEVKKRLHLPDDRVYVHESQLFSIASFYHMLSTKPRGRHVLLFCESAPCHVMGGRELWRAIRTELNRVRPAQMENGLW
jgi:NADH-quinone oxidoreductase subunit E